MRSTTFLAPVAVLTAAGCASQPAPAPDNTPQNPTAVFETKVSSTGFGGAFPFETTEKHYVRADMRRDEHATKGTGTFSGFLMTRMVGGEGDASIARVDRKLRWTVNNPKHDYTECPLTGCVQPGREKPEKPAEQQQPKQKAEEGCVLRLASSKFDVTPTGAKRTVNGFSADQYTMAWVVRLQDKQKRTTTSTVNVDLWTTPVAGAMRQALDTEAAYERAYAAAVARPSPQVRVERGAVMPPQLVPMMTAYLAGLTPADRAALQRAAHEFEKIKGHPVLTKIDWLVDGDACGAKDEQQAAAPQSGTAAVVSGLGSLMGKKEPEKSGPVPLVSFTIEVKQLGVAPMHDSVFSVPAGYKLTNPK